MDLHDALSKFVEQAREVYGHDLGRPLEICACLSALAAALPCDGLVDEAIGGFLAQSRQDGLRHVDFGFELNASFILLIVKLLQVLVHLTLLQEYVLVGLLQFLLLVDHLQVVKLQLVEQVLEHLGVREV